MESICLHYVWTEFNVDRSWRLSLLHLLLLVEHASRFRVRSGRGGSRDLIFFHFAHDAFLFGVLICW